MSAYNKHYDEMTEQEQEAAVLEYLPQVRYIALRIHERLPKHVPMEDMVHAGIIGLIDALQKFEPTRNVQFKSYASIRIRGAILDSLRELDWSPRELRRQARRVEEVARQLSISLGRAAEENEIAAALGMTLGEFQSLLVELDTLDLTSLQTGAEGEDGEGAPLEVPASTKADPLVFYTLTEMRERLAAAIGKLPVKEAQVLALYHYEELTMKEVGAVLGIGESRVSQIHSMALLRLRSQLRDWAPRKTSARVGAA